MATSPPLPMVIGGAMRRPTFAQTTTELYISVRTANAGERRQTFGDSRSVRHSRAPA
jgi:hypothetical protein